MKATKLFKQKEELFKTSKLSLLELVPSSKRMQPYPHNKVRSFTARNIFIW